MKKSKGKTRAFTIRLEEELIQEMEIYKTRNDVNWSSKIRKFIRSEVNKEKNISITIVDTDSNY